MAIARRTTSRLPSETTRASLNWILSGIKSRFRRRGFLCTSQSRMAHTMLTLASSTYTCTIGRSSWCVWSLIWLTWSSTIRSPVSQESTPTTFRWLRPREKEVTLPSRHPLWACRKVEGHTLTGSPSTYCTLIRGTMWHASFAVSTKSTLRRPPTSN